MIYEKHSQFLLLNQCSKYCQISILSEKLFTNLIINLIKKHHVLLFEISVFKTFNAEVIFTVYKKKTAIVEKDEAKALKTDLESHNALSEF